MTKEDLKDFLFHSMRWKDDFPPNHHIRLSFQCEELSLDELDSFVDSIQTKLNENTLGELLMYGIDEDQKRGDFIIYCNDTSKIKEAFELILPIIEACSIFQNGWYSLLLPTTSNGYKVEEDVIRETIATQEEDVGILLPVPEGYVENQKRGCFTSLAALVAFTVGLIALSILA
jgi:hypothetical protein